MLIAPSMLSSDFANLAAELRRIEAAGADWIHLDVMDGVFVPNITFGASMVAAMRPHTKLPFDVHLMIRDPAKYIDDFAKAGAQLITFHLESDSIPSEVIRRLREAGIRPAVALKPATPVEAVYPFLSELDMVLVMTVEPGFGGQRFMPDMMPKVRALKARAAQLGKPLLVEIDGGVTPETIRQAAEAGVDVCVAGTGVFKAPDAAVAIRELKAAAR